MLTYILWDHNGELFSWGQFTLRWNGLLFVLTFFTGRQILVHLYKKDGKPTKDIDFLTVSLIIGILLGGRLGHVWLYQPQLWAKPLTIFFPFEFKPVFHVIGATGFSSIGATLGIIAVISLYVLGKGSQQSRLQLLDKTSIVGIWIVVPIFISSFLSSEIEGKPTDSSIGAVFIQPVTNGLQQLPCCIMRNPGGKNPLTQVYATRTKDVAIRENGHHSIALYLFFKKDTPVQMVDEFMLGDVKTYLFDQSQNVYEPGTEPLHYAVFKEPTGDFDVRVRTNGVARYPIQLGEALSSFLLVLFLYLYWRHRQFKLPAGRIFGLGMILFWSLRFLYEFLKENQASFIKGLGINKTQVLCIPLILAGSVILFLSLRSHTAQPK